VWPGNLRELDTVIQSILVEADGAQRLEVGHLQREDPMTVLPARGMRSPSAERIAQVCRTSPTREIAARRLGVSIATLYRRLRQLREP
jgi:transcriptional regulator of acetoin/glycerol metabolism